MISPPLATARRACRARHHVDIARTSARRCRRDRQPTRSSAGFRGGSSPRTRPPPGDRTSREKFSSRSPPCGGRRARSRPPELDPARPPDLALHRLTRRTLIQRVFARFTPIRRGVERFISSSALGRVMRSVSTPSTSGQSLPPRTARACPCASWTLRRSFEERLDVWFAECRCERAGPLRLPLGRAHALPWPRRQHAALSRCRAGSSGRDKHRDASPVLPLVAGHVLPRLPSAADTARMPAMRSRAPPLEGRGVVGPRAPALGLLLVTHSPARRCVRVAPLTLARVPHRLRIAREGRPSRSGGMPRLRRYDTH